MSNIKNELILNPDYYSADMYVDEEEKQQSIYIRVFIQLFVVFIVFSILIFSYNYFMKNYYEEVHFWKIEAKVKQVVEKERTPIAIREEPIEHKVKNEKRVQVISVSEVKPQIVQHEELTDEYIKLVEQSLGNY
jgi:hypothetical protein